MAPAGGADPHEPPAPNPSPRAKRIFGAFVAAHMLAYPIAAVWAAGAVVPILAHMSANEIAITTPEEVARKVLVKLTAPSVLLFVLLHFAAIPWMRESEGRRGMIASLAILGTALLAGTLFAASTWLWLFLK